MQAGFRTDVAAVDFGRALEGARVAKTVNVTSTSRAGVELQLTTSAPFSSPVQLQLPAGGTVPLELTFAAGNSRATGTLTLATRDKTLTLPLAGEGVHPLSCQPSRPCRVSQFDLTSNACLESGAPEGAACQPTNICLDNGACRSGECVGGPRSCDNGNRCQVHACASGVGCVHLPVVCPPATHSCRVAACDPATGCGEATAPDFTPCGSLSCTSADLCIGGVCVLGISPPDGFPCAPATPCQSEGHCHQGQCDQPDAGELSAAYRLPLPMPPAAGRGDSALLAYQGNLFWQMCAAAPADGGTDGGCALASFTSNGFERFVLPESDGGSARLVAVSDAGILVRTDEAIQSFGIATGALQWTFPFRALQPPSGMSNAVPWTASDQIALYSNGEMVVSFRWRDGGMPASPEEDLGVQSLVLISPDGGKRLDQQLSAGGKTLVAVDSQERTWLYQPTGSLQIASPGDGGFSLGAVGNWAGGSSLVSSGSRLLVGAQSLVEPDGGILVAQFPQVGDAGEALEPLGDTVLAADGGGYLFYNACPSSIGNCDGGSPALALRAFSLSSGNLRWQSELIPFGTPGRLEEASLVSGGAVCALTQTASDAGWQSQFQLLASGQRLFSCPLPPGGLLGGATFDRGFGYVFVNRSGSWWLEAYDLHGLSFEPSGWPARHGLTGSRRSR